MCRAHRFFHSPTYSSTRQHRAHRGPYGRQRYDDGRSALADSKLAVVGRTDSVHAAVTRRDPLPNPPRAGNGDGRGNRPRARHLPLPRPATGRPERGFTSIAPSLWRSVSLERECFQHRRARFLSCAHTPAPAHGSDPIRGGGDATAAPKRHRWDFTLPQRTIEEGSVDLEQIRILHPQSRSDLGELGYSP